MYDQHTDFSCVLQVVDFKLIHTWLKVYYWSPSILCQCSRRQSRRGACCSHLVTVQLQIDVPFVGVEANVALLLHVLVAHGVVCDGVCVGDKGWVDYARVHGEVRGDGRGGSGCPPASCAVAGAMAVEVKEADTLPVE